MYVYIYISIYLYIYTSIYHINVVYMCISVYLYLYTTKRLRVSVCNHIRCSTIRGSLVSAELLTFSRKGMRWQNTDAYTYIYTCNDSYMYVSYSTSIQSYIAVEYTLSHGLIYLMTHFILIEPYSISKSTQEPVQNGSRLSTNLTKQLNYHERKTEK